MSVMKTTCLALLATAAVSSAGILNFSGDTAGGPTWNRPVAGNPPVPPPSGVGTAVPYQVTQIYVTANGSYDFLAVGVNPAGWDNYSFLYENGFNPATPFANVLIGNDDFPNIGLTGFSRNLTVGTDYFYVQTGFGNADSGAYNLTISGQGDIFIVPEPGQIALMALTGLGALGYAGRNWLRRRQQP
jgi:hypothetical protein